MTHWAAKRLSLPSQDEGPRVAAATRHPRVGHTYDWTRLTDENRFARARATTRTSFEHRSTDSPTGERARPSPSQRIAHLGPCGKALVVPENRRPRPVPTARGWRVVSSTSWSHGDVEPVVEPDLHPTGRRWPQRCCSIGADHVNPLRTNAFDLPDRLTAKADPALIAGDEQHFAAVGQSLEQVDRRPVRPARRGAQGARRLGPAGDGPGHGDPPADRSPARPASLRTGPVPGTHGRRRRPRAGVRRTTRPHGQRGTSAAARLALPRGRAVLRSDPRQPDGSGEPPQVSLDPWPDQRLLGRGVHPGRA